MPIEQPQSEPSPTLTFKPGDSVVIVANPFHEDAVGIVGEVVQFRPGGGFMGWDLADVRYQSPRTGEWHERPFGTAALDPGSREALLERAARHEEQAARMRAMAAEVRR